MSGRPIKFVDRNSSIDVIDTTSRNRFRWEWLSLKDSHGDFFSDYVRKLDGDGIAWCCYCQTEIKYGAGGVRCIRSHSEGKSHIAQRKVELLIRNRLPLAALQETKERIDVSTEYLPYSADPNPGGVGMSSRSELGDVSHQEALVSSFMSEHTLPMTMAPHLVSLAQELVRDPKALQDLHRKALTEKGASSSSRRFKRPKTMQQIGSLDEPSSAGTDGIETMEHKSDVSEPIETEIVKLEPEDVDFEQNNEIPGQVHSQIHVQAPNSHLSLMKKDVLYHIAMDTETHNFKEMFSDVKFVCFGGSPTRMEKFAHYLVKELKVHIPAGLTLENIAKGSDRYVMYKVGPVLSVSHGMGIPSMSIIFHEVVKLLHYAQCTDVIFLRIGTCGGLGLTPGSVVISQCVVDGALCPYMEVISLGKVHHYPSTLDEGLAKELLSLSDPVQEGFETIMGKTMCTLDFYEGQARLDGAFCGYTEEDKMEFLHHIYSEGVRNIEMESLCFAAHCNRAGIKGAVVCVSLLDRLQGDQLDIPHSIMDDWQIRPQALVTKLMKTVLGII